MVLRLFHKTGRKRVANIRPKSSRRFTHALGSKVTASLDTKKLREIPAVEMPAKTALGLIKFSLDLGLPTWPAKPKCRLLLMIVTTNESI